MNLALPIRATPQGDIPLRRRMFFKIAIAFILSLSATGLLQLFFSVREWRALTDELEQQVHWEFASELVQQIQPLVRDTIDNEALERELYRIAVVYRKVDLFMLDVNGKILAYSLLDTELLSKAVDIGPIEQSLQVRQPELPLYGSNPADPKTRRVFSVAPLTVAGKPGYLYVILGSNMYSALKRMTGQFALVRVMIEGILAASALASFIGLLIFWFISQHLRTLTAVVSAYREGDFSRRVPIESNDEIGALSQTVNAMAATIVERTDALRNNDIRRRELVAFLTHDLRGPLTSLRANAEHGIQNAGVLPEHAIRELFERIHEGILSEQQLIDDLFELTKLDAADLQLEQEAFSLEELTRDVLVQLQSAAVKAGIELQLLVPAELTPVIADPVLLQRVLFNLLYNAVRHCTAGTSVTITLIPEAGGVRVAISDTGSGISPEKLRALATMQEVDTTGKLSAERGLGLIIVGRILTLHGIGLTVESEAGKGTTFRFVVPAA